MDADKTETMECQSSHHDHHSDTSNHQHGDRHRTDNNADDSEEHLTTSQLVTVQLYDQNDQHHDQAGERKSLPHFRRRVLKSTSFEPGHSNRLTIDTPLHREHYFMTVCARRLNRHLRDLSLSALHVQFSPTGDDTTDSAPQTEKLNSLSSVLASSTQSSHGTQRLFYREQYEQESQILSGESLAREKKFKSWKFKRAKQWHKDKQAILDFLGYFKLWSSALKTIEGSFGSSVVSYFQFIRWLFLLNIFIFLCILGVVILPQALVEPKSFQDSIKSENASLTANQEMAMFCSENYSNFVKENTKNDVTSVMMDVFQGTGLLQNTYIFLGYYFNKTYFSDLSESSYDLPLAHLINTAGYLLITLILMVRYTANGIREKILSKGYHYHKCWSLVFCGWDYTLCKRKAASYKHLSLRKEMMTVLLELELAEKQRMMKKRQKACIYLKRVVINIITVVCLGGCFALIYYVVEVWKPMLLETSRVANNDILTLVVEYLPSVTITVLNFIIPFIFNYLVIFEEYSPSTELRLNISRTVFLRLASLVTLAVTMFRLITCDEKETTCGSCNANIKCWETYIGQELYKLVVLDFVIILATTFLVEFPRKALVTRVKKLKMFQQEFDLPVNVLNIVYSQTLCWWGAFYSPLIPAMTIVKLFLLFYCKKISLFVNQTPPHRPYQTAKSNHFFMMILMVSFMLSVVALTYTLGWIIPSQGCSPFRVYVMPDYRLYHCVTAAVRTLPSWLRFIFSTLTSWIAYGLCLMILSLLIYFLRAKSEGSERVINILRDQFALLEKDKKFLLDHVHQTPHL